MATNEQGSDWRVRIKVGATYVPIAGETSLDWKNSNAENDVSDKDSGAYGATQYGQKKVSISVSGNLKLPDPGFAALEQASNATPPVADIEIVKGDVVKFQGQCGVGNFNASFPKGQPATYSYDLANAAAPTINSLNATGE